MLIDPVTTLDPTNANTATTNATDILSAVVSIILDNSILASFPGAAYFGSNSWAVSDTGVVPDGHSL